MSFYSSGNVWTPPLVQPVQPVVQSSSRSIMSFAAIQLAQAEQDAPATKDKRSLVEIQEEERARQVEEDFLRWWAAEEERLKEEQAATAALLAGPPKKSKKLKGGPKSKGPASGISSDTQVQQPQKDGKGGHARDGARKRPREKPAGGSASHGSNQPEAVEHDQGQRGQTQSQGGKSRRGRPAQSSGARDDTRLPDARKAMS